jgi:8-amino-7-oxononanoate synthase
MDDASEELTGVAGAAPGGGGNIGAPGGAPAGRYRMPAHYTGLRHAFEAHDETGFADLFYQTFDGLNSGRARLHGRDVVNFCSYDYLGMCGDPAVSRAAVEAIVQYGTSVSASRLVSGERPVHRALERALADWIGTEDAICFVSGYATNADVIGHVVGPGDLVIYDSLIHISVRQGIRVSGAAEHPFPHGRLDVLERLLGRARHTAGQVLIVVEGVYSMDGDVPDLARLVAIKQQYDALLMVDEAHSMGVLGATGRGIGEHCGVAAADVDLWMGTLSKTFVSCGGYIAGRRELVTYLRYTVPGFVYSVGLAPPLAAAALAALDILRREPERVARLRARTGLFHTLAAENGLDIGSASAHSAIVPIMVGQVEAGAWLSRYLLARDILALPIAFPAVPRNRTRLRLFISSSHTEAQIRQVAAALAQGTVEMRRLGA